MPDEKTTALGGVATGSINAKLDAMTSGMAIDMGATEIATAMDVAIGKKVDVVAVFDVSSVRKTMKVVITNTEIPRIDSGARLSPNH